MHKLKLMAELETSGIWDEGPDGPGDLDPGDLPISNDLQSALVEWAERFDETVDQDSQPGSGFATPEEAQTFVADGETLAQRLREELGDDWYVEYEPEAVD